MSREINCSRASFYVIVPLRSMTINTCLARQSHSAVLMVAPGVYAWAFPSCRMVALSWLPEGKWRFVHATMLNVQRKNTCFYLFVFTFLCGSCFCVGDFVLPLSGSLAIYRILVERYKRSAPNDQLPPFLLHVVVACWDYCTWRKRSYANLRKTCIRKHFMRACRSSF